jgi:tetratricopeptide (TPR) repeat protein
MMNELDDETYAEIQRICATGDDLVNESNYEEALTHYWKAYDLIPNPKTDWEATLWILIAIGDTNFLMNDFQSGATNLALAMHCPEAIGNPFIHLRLGQCMFELGFLDSAADELTRAYAVEGEEIFAEEDPKYFVFLKTRIVIE